MIKLLTEETALTLAEQLWPQSFHLGPNGNYWEGETLARALLRTQKIAYLLGQIAEVERGLRIRIDTSLIASYEQSRLRELRVELEAIE